MNHSGGFDGSDDFERGDFERGDFERGDFERGDFEADDFEAGDRDGAAHRGANASVRAQRLLVRVLLALRGESRRSASPAREARRAELLADRILADFPRRVLPIGLAAVAIVVLACSFPLVRDALPAAHLGAQSTPVATALESGLRTQGAAMSDGIEALRAIMTPFAGGASNAAAPGAEAAIDESSEVSPEAAAAPFTQS